jgi:hypothetical protein
VGNLSANIAILSAKKKRELLHTNGDVKRKINFNIIYIQRSQFLEEL